MLIILGGPILILEMFLGQYSGKVFNQSPKPFKEEATDFEFTTSECKQTLYQNSVSISYFGLLFYSF